MPNRETDMIQPGWEIWTSDGAKLGRIVSVDEAVLKVKKDGLLGGEVFVPKDAVSEVEQGRVEVTLTKEQATAH